MMNSMNNDNQPPTQPVQQLAVSQNEAIKQPKKSNKTKVFVWIIILVLLAGNIALGYLYYTQSKEVTDLQKQLESAKQVKEEPVTDANATNAAKTSYTATVGKFSLSLPDNLVIIKKLDGGFEGGPATILQVTQVLDKEKGVVGSDNPFSEVKITAIPTTTFDSSRGIRIALCHIYFSKPVCLSYDVKPDAKPLMASLPKCMVLMALATLNGMFLKIMEIITELKWLAQTKNQVKQLLMKLLAALLLIKVYSTVTDFARLRGLSMSWPSSRRCSRHIVAPQLPLVVARTDLRFLGFL
jgi:hypothetical protein